MRVLKISSKGRITIPVDIRRKLGTDLLTLEMVGEEIVLKPLKYPAGALRKYSIKNRPIEEIIKLEKEVVFRDREC